MRTILVLVTLLMLGPLEVNGQWCERETGAPAPDNEWRKTTGDLGAMLVVTTQPEGFLRDWRTTPQAYAPRAAPSDRVQRGGVIAVLLFFSGCAVAAGQACPTVVDFKVLRPDGSVYGDFPANKVWPHPAPRQGLALLSEAHLEIDIEPDDPFGTYTVLAVLREPQSGRVIQLRRGFAMIEGK